MVTSVELYTFCRNTTAWIMTEVALACARAVVFGIMRPSIEPVHAVMFTSLCLDDPQLQEA